MNKSMAQDSEPFFCSKIRLKYSLWISYQEVISKRLFCEEQGSEMDVVVAYHCFVRQLFALCTFDGIIS